MTSKLRKQCASSIMIKLIFVFFFIFSISSYAINHYDPNLNQIVHPPHHIKPNMPTTVPSGYSPALIKKAYGLNLISKQGEGQTIAVIVAFDNPNIESDLAVFSTEFNLPACTTANGCFKKIYASGYPPPPSRDWGLEIALDVQWAHAIAPKAKILLVEAEYNIVSYLVKAVRMAPQKGATIATMSWGAGEFPDLSQYDRYFKGSGATFIASSGDSGNGVQWPAVSPYVISVGGTSLTLDDAGNYVSETAWWGSGGGLSVYVSKPSYQNTFADEYNPNNMRGVPDVSLIADPNTGIPVYDTYGYGGWLVVGGTSASAPILAGIMAVAKSVKSSLRGLNSLLYKAATTNYSANYHDIKSGTNGGCGPVCTARPGYDYVTGLGTPQAQNLIQTLTS